MRTTTKVSGCSRKSSSIRYVRDVVVGVAVLVLLLVALKSYIIKTA